jgi:hypothetical protein
MIREGARIPPRPKRPTATNVLMWASRFLDRESFHKLAEILHRPKRGDFCRNPITGSQFIWGLDPLRPQIEKARRAVHAQFCFALLNPNWPMLQVNYFVFSELKYKSPKLHILALYTYHLSDLDFDIDRATPFDRYVRGAMANASIHEWLVTLAERDEDSHDEFLWLAMRYPPEPLPGLKADGGVESNPVTTDFSGASPVTLGRRVVHSQVGKKLQRSKP